MLNVWALQGSCTLAQSITLPWTDIISLSVRLTIQYPCPIFRQGTTKYYNEATGTTIIVPKLRKIAKSDGRRSNAYKAIQGRAVDL